MYKRGLIVFLYVSRGSTNGVGLCFIHGLEFKVRFRIRVGGWGYD